MSAHPHASKMIQYGKDAQWTDKPWAFWSAKVADDDSNLPIPLTSHPDWDVSMVYHRNPTRELVVNGKKLAGRFVLPPEFRVSVYFVTSDRLSGVASFSWDDDSSDRTRLSTGLCFDTERHAREFLDALKEI